MVPLFFEGTNSIKSAKSIGALAPNPIPAMRRSAIYHSYDGENALDIPNNVAIKIEERNTILRPK
jgi:hypothetical protein